jgi:hypothetical protein
MIRSIYTNIIILLIAFLSVASQGSDREYKVKAAFLFNLAQFIEWPSNVLSEPDSPLTIGILGENPFGAYLEGIVSGENVNGHPLLVKHCQVVEEATTCQIVFINLPEKIKMKETITALKGRSILTVSDKDNFIREGGMVELIKKTNKIGLVISTQSTKEDNLIISSKLLQIAQLAH